MQPCCGNPSFFACDFCQCFDLFAVFDAKRAGFDKVVFVIKKEIEKDFKEVIGKRIEKIHRRI